MAAFLFAAIRGARRKTSIAFPANDLLTIVL